MGLQSHCSSTRQNCYYRFATPNSSWYLANSSSFLGLDLLYLDIMLANGKLKYILVLNPLVSSIIANLYASSANDCGSTCGPGHVPNTIGEMLMVAFIGLCMFGTGAAILIKNEVAND